ncbi:MAG: succinate dehydrogenase, hydrophobic membrane anchor protein [Pseudomonadota bacterium]
MVTTASTLGLSGLQNWLIQRVSGVVLLGYFTFLGCYIGINSPMEYAQWQGLFDHIAMRVFSIAAIVSIALHAWIGLWCVLTDYLTTRMLGSKGNVVRGAASAVCSVTILVYVIWGVQIVWS